MNEESKKNIVQTVRGSISPDKLGSTMTHEHLIIDFSMMLREPRNPNDIEMMDGIKNLNDFAYIYSGSAGYPGTFEWVKYGGDPTGVPMSSGTTSVQVNEVIPYVQTGQLIGLLAGMPGAAEYEKLINVPGIAIQGMAAQSFAHIVIVLFIVFGNLAFFIKQRRDRKY